MDWYPIILGIITGAISVVIDQLLPKRLNVWLRGVISIIIVAILCLIFRFIFGAI